MKYLLFFIPLTFFFSSCKQEEPEICSSPPPSFALLVSKKSELYRDFMNSKGEFDKEEVFYYKLTNNTKQIYPIQDTYEILPNGNVYLGLVTSLWFENDIYTGKTETLYLQNATKTYKIEINGEMIEGRCGPLAHINEILIDGVKIEKTYLAK